MYVIYIYIYTYVYMYICLSESAFFFEKKRDSELYELDSELCGLRNGKPHLCKKKTLTMNTETQTTI